MEYRNLMSEPYDISTYKENLPVRFYSEQRTAGMRAPIDFVLYNHGALAPKDTDEIILTLSDADGNKVPVTLNIHWKESIVSAVQMASGKQYEGMNDTAPVK